MKRRKQNDGAMGTITKVLGAGVAVLAGYLVAVEITGLWRYVKIRRMAKPQGGASPEILPPPGAPTYAQAPRRALAARW